MRRIAVILSLLLGLGFAMTAQQSDSVRFAVLDGKLQEYVTAIEAAGPEVQKEECDFLISTASDSLVRQHIALKLYDHYLTSKVMGSEAVAIHILDRWFFTHEISMPDEISLINARVYADFNRQSLIGEKAPAIDVEDMEGKRMSLYSVPAERYSVLYFYDTDCAKCRVETILLRSLLSDNEYPVDLIAFYVGDDREAWQKYVADRVDVASENVNVVNVWDPQVDSDFQRKYGVLQTPRMFLVRPDGTIVGRNLDTGALRQMLEILFSEKKLDYGNDEAFALFDAMFASGSVSQEDVKGVADSIAAATLGSADVVMYRQLMGDYLYYLSGKPGQAYKEGLAYLLDEYILGDDRGVWKSADDSLKVIGFAQMMDDLLSKSVPGSRIADIKVPGVLLKKGKSKTRTMSLRKLGGRENIVLFHTEGCHVCASEMEAAKSLVESDRNVRVFMVNVDEIVFSHPSLASRMFDIFDLSSLPYLLKVDRQGVILSRYLTLQK